MLETVGEDIRADLRGNGGQLGSDQRMTCFLE